MKRQKQPSPALAPSIASRLFAEHGPEAAPSLKPPRPALDPSPSQAPREAIPLTSRESPRAWTFENGPARSADEFGVRSTKSAEPRTGRPKRPSMHDAQRTADAFCAGVGKTRALRQCVRECAEARRARSRRRFAFWTEVARILGKPSEGVAALAVDRTALAQNIAQLIEPLVGIAKNSGFVRLAQILAQARAHAAQFVAVKEF